jgi:hypothetical protein
MKREVRCSGRGQLGNPEERQRSTLEAAATKQRLMESEKPLCVM